MWNSIEGAFPIYGRFQQPGPHRHSADNGGRAERRLMPVDPKRVADLIEELGLEGADKDYFTKVLTTNEKAGVAFTGQRERHDAFTQKTQALSQKEKDLEKRANDQVQAYAQQLNEAQDRLRKIMDDFQNSEISRTKAES